MRKFLLVLLVLLLIGAGVLAWLALARPAYDPVEVGKAETRMWKAYYGGNRTQLGILLVQLLRKQYGLRPLEAKEIGELLASSAMTFKAARGQYEEKVMPDLTRAYRGIQEATGVPFDPVEVARAELAWWVARRTPGQDSAEQIGQKIGQLYATLYGGDHPAFHEAGMLRARAARLRDEGAAKADWAAVEVLLIASYTALGEAM